MKHREITGSLAERNGRYTAILNLYDEDGKRRQKSIALGIPVKGNKRKAQAQLEELKRAYSLGLPQEGKTGQESQLFADFLRDWLEITAPTIERTTYQSYRGLIAARLDPFFRARGLRLRELEPKHIRELHRSIFADGCGANTVIHYHAVVRKALQYAVKNGLVDGNVADQVDRPKKGKYLAGFYTREELAALFEATKDDSISVVIQLAAYYGLRRSEVLGIRWSAIDDEKGTLSINHKVTEGMVDGRHQIYTEDKLKTKSSFRTLPLIPAVRALLDEQRARQEEYRRLFKKSYCTEYLDYVCTDEMGRLFRPNYITDHFIIYDCGVMQTPTSIFRDAEHRLLCGSVLPYEIPVFHKALSECGSLEVRPVAICVPQEIQEYCTELFGEDVQIAAASHDLFAKQVNGQIYRPLVEKYIAGEKRL